MKAASRLTDCLLKDLAHFDLPLTSECAELAHFAAIYLWYGCCGGANPTPQDGIGSDLSQKDNELFGICCQYLELLLLGRKEAATVPKQMTVILKSFRKPPTSAKWKVVTERVQKVLQSVVHCIEATDSADTQQRLSLVCCWIESVAVFISFLISFQKSAVAESIVQDFLASLKSSDFIGQGDSEGVNLVGRMLSSFVKSIAGTKLSKEPTSFDMEIVKKCLSSLNSSLQEFKSRFAEIQPVTARTVITCANNLITSLLCNKDGDILSAEALQIAVALYSCQLELCEEVLLQLSDMPNESNSMCQIVCLKRDVWFRKLQLINAHLQKNSSDITGMYRSVFSRTMVGLKYLSVVQILLIVANKLTLISIDRNIIRSKLRMNRI